MLHAFITAVTRVNSPDEPVTVWTEKAFTHALDGKNYQISVKMELVSHAKTKKA